MYGVAGRHTCDGLAARDDEVKVGFDELVHMILDKTRRD